MKAAVTIKGGAIALSDVEELPLAPGQVRVDVIYCGMCGSDLHWRLHFPAGTVMGHEVTGTIAEMAPDVEGWSIGQRVDIMPIDPCGECGPCRDAQHNLCTNRRFGIGGPRANGGYAERVVVMATMLVALPEDMSDRTAALVEPLSVGLHAVNRSGAKPSQPVAVMGAGTIGLMTVLALRAKGFTRIVSIEPTAERRAHIAALGVRAIEPRGAAVALAEILGEAPRTIFECAGYPGAVTDAIGLVAPRGKVVLVAAPAEPVPLPQFDLISKEAEIGSAIFYTREEFEEAVTLLASGAVPADAVPLSIFALDDAPRALEELVQRDTPHMKVLLQPAPEPVS